MIGLIWRSIVAVFSLAFGIYLLRFLVTRLTSTRSDLEHHLAASKDAVAGLDHAGLRERFVVLAPEFRKTHAGAGTPRSASYAEIETLMSLGLVECVKRPHVAAGMLSIYKLTPLGEAVDKRLAKPDGSRRSFRVRLIRSTGT